MRAGPTQLVCFLLAGCVCAQDTNCPAFPNEQRAALMRAVRQSNDALRLRRQSHRIKIDASSNVNFIDDLLFGQMAADGITPADPAPPEAFLRRVTLDLTGRIPNAGQVTAWLNSTDPGKESALLDRLTGSNEFIDYWTLWLGNKFQVTSNYYLFIGVPGRNLFYNYLRDFVARDRSYQDFVSELITATGDSHQTGAPNFLLRSVQYSQPLQDTFDETTNRITTLFLGVQSTCISCHNGRGHLENINYWLSQKRRVDFWQQSAFFSRMNFLSQQDDAADRSTRSIFSDRLSGGYNSVLADPSNPGPRPLRTGGPYSPVYIFSGAQAQSNIWRKDLANLVVNSRQFALATVNYLWAHFFRAGIVDPPDGWDLARQDPASPPPSSGTTLTPLQPSNPALLNALADEFISSGYSIKHMIRLMVQSRAYHLSSTYNGTWTPLHAVDFAKSFPRRLSAEEIYDAMVTATNTPTPMQVEGFGTLNYAGQLPDPAEPRNPDFLPNSNGDIFNMLQTFGRGDWFLTPRDTKSNVVQALYLMNDYEVVFRTFGNKYRMGNSLVAQLATSNLSDRDAITQMCLATLGRYPTNQEMAAALSYQSPSAQREYWLADIEWVFLNEIDFLFNH